MEARIPWLQPGECQLLNRYVDLIGAPAPASTPVGALFARRAGILASLRHPALPLVYDLVTHDGCAIVVRQHIEGPALAHSLAVDRGCWTVARALRLVAALGDALGIVHGAGLYHGAVCADSIIVGAGDDVFVGDLAWPHLDAVRFSAKGAPEVRAGTTPTARSDVFALGALLRLCLALTEEDLGGVALPAEVRDLIRGATVLEPSQRYPSGTELAQAARAVLAGAASMQHTMALPAIPPRGRRIAPRRLLAPAAIIAAALGLWAMGGTARVAGVAALLPSHLRGAHVQRTLGGHSHLARPVGGGSIHRRITHPAMPAAPAAALSTAVVEPPTNTPGPTWTATATVPPADTPIPAPTETAIDPSWSNGPGDNGDNPGLGDNGDNPGPGDNGSLTPSWSPPHRHGSRWGRGRVLGPGDGGANPGGPSYGDLPNTGHGGFAAPAPPGW